MTKTDLMQQLKEKCNHCQGCALADTRTNLVFGDGNPSSPVLFVGEGPGEQEDLQGKPFVGRGGQLLDLMLDIIDLNRARYYIANIVKCRPPKNRDPLHTEQDACSNWLSEQIQIIQPKILVCLGRVAACRMIDDNYKITRQHGQWQQVNGIWMTAIYHPAALLRDESKRPETFDDLKSIQHKIREICPEVFQL